MKAIKKKASVHPSRVELRAGLVFMRDLFTRGERVHISDGDRHTLRALCGSISRAYSIESYRDREWPDRYVCPACYTMSKATTRKKPVEVQTKTNSHIERHNAIQTFRSAEHKFESLACRIAATYGPGDREGDRSEYAIYKYAIEARDAIAALRSRIEDESGGKTDEE